MPEECRSLQHMKADIRDAVGIVTHNKLPNTCTEVEYHLDMCNATRGAHTETY
jgi:hypothetical protein